MAGAAGAPGGRSGDGVDGVGSVERVFAVVAAAGSGNRLGEVLPKAFVEVDGRTILERCLDGLAASQAVGHTVVTVSSDMLEHTRDLVAAQSGLWGPMDVSVVLGGADRADSVRAGLESVHALVGDAGQDAGLDGGSACAELGEVPTGFLVAVHDAARCLTPPDMIRATVAVAAEGVEDGTWAGVVPVLPVTDTVKVVETVSGGAVDGAEVIRSTPERRVLRAAQTPQVFALDRLIAANRMQQAREELDSAHPTGNPPSDLAPAAVTDDSSLMEMAGETVAAVAGDERAFKITLPEDLERAHRAVGNGGVA
ncbi:MAG: IspD/TarI family cytidylyltransferase [Corynebacterium sp.]|uniref:IspD/TarI family cytidylyltransferase n=1 Tax=unclassified Corynebacterium TaxID=2624378 RepID=UPI00264A0F9D|nr:IspD/TarI family cytidylyltransferase [Corynebacterium sp.]MDN5583115.1 2-C-methyl-D-erythritol 4-phosphate cytidylyltransferase [Corynebacterium sp.]MDN5721263.1 2-C-methyl-D-erythritol 4-phosphate cytidylyltransferase [Corynebacterium sp.]MDN6387513.1 2-C-methyl-D-erythritol 4-phosphate cytidylyltransferase [Corynebacterium sp.]MDN6511079.1 2-C-methyl-D-erythritol 4-phosphate cytidylyltransferase [Corynebacterium sp.]